MTPLCVTKKCLLPFDERTGCAIVRADARREEEENVSLFQQSCVHDSEEGM